MLRFLLTLSTWRSPIDDEQSEASSSGSVMTVLVELAVDSLPKVGGLMESIWGRTSQVRPPNSLSGSEKRDREIGVSHQPQFKRVQEQRIMLEVAEVGSVASHGITVAEVPFCLLETSLSETRTSRTRLPRSTDFLVRSMHGYVI